MIIDFIQWNSTAYEYHALSLLNPITTVVNLFNLDGTIAVDGNGASKLNPDKATNLNSYWKVKGINHLLFMQAAN